MVRFDTPDVLLPEIIGLHARSFPEKPALVCGEVVASWREFDARLNAFASALLRLGAGRNSRVGVLADPCVEAIYAEFGTLRAGAAVASLSTLVTPDALAEMIADSRATVLVVTERYREVVDAIRDRLNNVPEEGYILIGGSAPGWINFDSLLRAAPASAAALPDQLCGGDELCIIYSSGTTSTPKGIVLTHRCRLMTALMTSGELGYNAKSIVLVAAALHSNTAWSLLIRGFLFGATVVLMTRFDAREFCRLVAAHRVTHTTLVPVQIQKILDEPDAVAPALSSIKALVSTGSFMPLALKQRVIARFPEAFYEVYGLTEGIAAMLKPEDMAQHIDSSGRPAIGNDIRILDEHDRESPAGSRGEIVGYGPQLMDRYNDSPEKTAQSMWREPASGRTFLRSGDVGYFDADGFLHVVDRKKDMIVSGGYNIFPVDIEGVLGTHPDVREACVIGVPDSKWGETPLVLVVPASTMRIEAEALRDWLNQRLGKHQRVSRVIYRQSLPRNAGGKVLKQDLRREFMNAPGNAAMHNPAPEAARPDEKPGGTK